MCDTVCVCVCVCVVGVCCVVCVFVCVCTAPVFAVLRSTSLRGCAPLWRVRLSTLARACCRCIQLEVNDLHNDFECADYTENLQAPLLDLISTHMGHTTQVHHALHEHSKKKL